MAVVLLVGLLLFFAMGVPIAIALGLSSAIALLWDGNLSLIILVQRFFTSIDSFPLLAIPLFILAGTIMEVGGLSQRLVNFANAITGHLPGGLGLVMVVTSLFFSAISGSGAATAAAVGSILIPSMIARGYHKRFAAALQSASGELGIILPPSIPIILYGVTTGTSIGALFLAGVIPGLLIAVGLMIAVYGIAKKRGYKREKRATAKEFWTAFREAGLALVMPVIILGGIYLGFFTATEAAGVAVLYAFIVGFFIYREIKWQKIQDLLASSAITTSVILFIISSAGLFAWIITREGIPQQIAGMFMEISDNPIVFLMIVNVFLIAVGMFMEANALIIILAPLLTPVAMELGVDPVQFGLIMIINLAIGLCTPPVGVNLFISAQIAGIRIDEITLGMIPFYVVLLTSLVLVTYFPFFTTWLPSLLL